MKSVSIMIKPASSLCNMRCRYCFYNDISEMREVKSYGVMSEETQAKILENVYTDLDAGDKITFVFQGGEPTLAGLDYFKLFVARVKAWKKEISVSYSIQTNALLIDENWCTFLKENKFLVGISFDLLEQYHDGARVDSKKSGTYKTVLEKIKMLGKYGIDYNVLTTLTSYIARHPIEVWKKIVSLDITYTQFTPCLADLDCKKSSDFALTPKLFANFYLQIADLWLKEYRSGKRRSIKFFDDTINLMLFGKPTLCGMNGICQPQIVVEADGSVYPCDLYCLDKYKLGNLTETGFLTLLSSEVVREFLQTRNSAPKTCADCRYRRYCGTGCKRMQNEVYVAAADDGYCGYRAFLDAYAKDFLEIANYYRLKFSGKIR